MSPGPDRRAERERTNTDSPEVKLGDRSPSWGSRGSIGSVTLAERAWLALAVGALALLPNVRGSCDEPQGKLDLVVEAANDTLAQGEELDLTVSLRNSGQGPLELYHPESIHRASPCWSLRCRVTPPRGNVLDLAPDTTFANVPTERRQDFQRLGPGGALEIGIHLQVDDPAATHTPSGWVGLIPISRAELELPEDLIKRRHGVQGKVFFISGSEVHLAIRDLLKDVFHESGEYLLDFEYQNDCTRFWDLTAEGKSVLKAVDGAWSGRLSDALVITIED